MAEDPKQGRKRRKEEEEKKKKTKTTTTTTKICRDRLKERATALGREGTVECARAVQIGLSRKV